MAEIRKVDKSDMLSFLVQAPQHYEKAAKLAEKIKTDFPKPKSIVIAGMGGSAIGGELLKDWSTDKTSVPIEVCRAYSLPNYANDNTLVVAVSYSGETEETLSVFLDALERKCRIICVSSGGTLQRFAENLGVSHLQVPSGMAPRVSLPYLFTPLCVLMEKLGLVSRVDEEISEAVETLSKVCNTNQPEEPSRNNVAKTLALNIFETMPFIYGFDFYRSVAQRIKTQFNENSKIPAKWEVFPELDHNEIVGWEAVGKLSKYFSAILLRDDEESEAIRRRIEVTKELMHEQSVRTFELRSQGKSTMARMLSLVCIGDFTSIYLAILRGIDPTPVKTINALKKKIERSRAKATVVAELQKIVVRRRH
jgi:glucose/mannose-6-phosphate isomerase